MVQKEYGALLRPSSAKRTDPIQLGWAGMDFLVGTFNTPAIYTLSFTPATETLHIRHVNPAPGSHSWLTLSPSHQYLYATIWRSPSAVAAFRALPDHTLQLVNTKPVRRTSGYVTASSTHLYSAGGPSGEVFRLNADGSIGALVQELSLLDEGISDVENKSGDQHSDFGRLRHGAHSVDLSPDQRTLYIADIRRNCVWTYAVKSHAASSLDPPLRLSGKHVAPRANDGPRHATPHPNGRVLYSVQEHSNVVDEFVVSEDGTALRHVRGVEILPPGKRTQDFWADEVRVSRLQGVPRYVYASTRGLEAGTKGWVVVWTVDEEGMIEGDAADRWETPTSGGVANAIEPAPGGGKGERRHGMDEEVEYLALTDSQEGWVFMLSFNGKNIAEVARVKLTDERDERLVVKAATAVWL